MDYEALENLSPKRKQGRTKKEKIAGVQKILKQTEWLQYPWIFVDAPAQSGFEDIETELLKISPKLPDDKGVLWWYPIKAKIANQLGNKLYALKFSPDVHENLPSAWDDERPVLWETAIRIDQQLLGKTKRAIQFASQFPKMFPQMVGDIKSWQKKQLELLEAARQKFRLCAAYPVAYLVYTIYLGDGRFTEEFKHQPQKLYTLIQNPKIPDKLKKAFSFILGNIDAGYKIPHQFKDWYFSGTRYSLNQSALIINMMYHFNETLPDTLFTNLNNKFYREIIENAFLFSMFYNKNYIYFQRYVSFINATWKYVTFLGKELYWLLLYARLYDELAEDILYELLYLIEYESDRPYNAKRYIQKILTRFHPRKNVLGGVAVSLRTQQNFEKMLQIISDLKWDESIFEKINGENIEFLLMHFDELMQFIGQQVELAKDDDIDLDAQTNAKLLKLFKVLVEEDFLKISLELKLVQVTSEHCLAFAENTENFRRVVTTLKQLYDFKEIKTDRLNIDYVSRTFWLVLYYIFNNHIPVLERETRTHLKQLIAEINAMPDYDKMYNGFVLPVVNYYQRFLNKKALIEFFSRYFKLINTFDNEQSEEFLIFYGYNIIYIFSLIYKENWQHLLDALEILLKQIEDYQDANNWINFKKIQHWLSKNISHSLFIKFLQRAFLIPEYPKPLLKILEFFAYVPAHFQDRVRTLLNNLFSPEVPPEFVNPIAHMRRVLNADDFQRLSRIARYYSMIHGTWGLPKSLKKLLDAENRVQKEVDYLNQLEKAGTITYHQQQRLKKLKYWINHPDEFRNDWHKKVVKELRNHEISMVVEVLKSQKYKILTLWWHGHFLELPMPSNKLYVTNALILLENTTRNKNYLKKMIYYYVKEEPVAFQFKKNIEFLERFAQYGGNVEGWLSPYKKVFHIKDDVWTVYTSEDPMEILLMGRYFSTCLTPGRENDFATIANAIEINKKVIFIRNKAGNVIGRKLIVLSKLGRILYGFNDYNHFKRREDGVWVDILLNQAYLEMAFRANAIVLLVDPKFVYYFWDICKKKRYIFLSKDLLEEIDGEMLYSEALSLFADWYNDEPIWSSFPLPMVLAISGMPERKVRKLLHDYLLNELLKLEDIYDYFDSYLSNVAPFYYGFVWLGENVIPLLESVIRESRSSTISKFIQEIKPVLISNATTYALERQLHLKFEEWEKRINK